MTAGTARSEAWERFCRQVLSAELRPGQFLTQRGLGERLRMPLAAVRELIPRLEAAGLLRTVPQRGLQLVPADLRLIREAFQLRTMIEREAIRHFVHEVGDDELDALEARHRALLARSECAEPDAALDEDTRALDWGLHDRMVDSLGNHLLSEIYRVNSLHVRLIALDSDRIVAQRVRPAMQEHLVFIAALRARDEGAAVAALHSHIEASRGRVLDAARQPLVVA